MYTIDIIDDHAMVRHSFKELINVLSKNFKVGNVWESANEFILNLRRNKSPKPNLALIDYKMPGLNGGCLSYLLQRDFPEINKLGMSGENEPGWIEEFIHYGCKGFVSKAISPNDLITAIETALNNRYYHNIFVDKYLTHKVENGLVTHHFPCNLNDNQYLYFHLCLTSLTNQEMAVVLNIKEETLHKMQQRLFKKLAVKSKGELISWMLNNKIVRQY